MGPFSVATCNVDQGSPDGSPRRSASTKKNAFPGNVMLWRDLRRISGGSPPDKYAFWKQLPLALSEGLLCDPVQRRLWCCAPTSSLRLNAGFALAP